MYRILIADDEPIERMVICKILQNYFKDEIQIAQATNGREAIEQFEVERSEIVILDIEMPGINGIEAAEKIRSQDKECSIIFLTAFDCFSYTKKAITLKALDYLLKPSSEEELISVVEKAIKVIQEKKLPYNKKLMVHETGLMPGEKNEQIRTSIMREHILEFIKEHYMYDISLQDAANVMNYSDTYFCKLFKHCFNKSFTTYLSEFRIGKAKELLIDMTINIKEVGERVGYRDCNYFAKVFKRLVGITPSEYRMLVLEKHRDQSV